MRDVKNMLRWMIGCVVLALTATTSAAQPGTELSPLASTLKVMTFNIRFGTANDGEPDKSVRPSHSYALFCRRADASTTSRESSDTK